jgi:hypothetical protein
MEPKTYLQLENAIKWQKLALAERDKKIAELERELACPCCTKGHSLAENAPCQECHGTGMVNIAYETCRMHYKLLEQENAKLIAQRDNAILATCSYSPTDASCKGSESMRQENATLTQTIESQRSEIARLQSIVPSGTQSAIDNHNLNRDGVDTLRAEVTKLRECLEEIIKYTGEWIMDVVIDDDLIAIYKIARKGLEGK